MSLRNEGGLNFYETLHQLRNNVKELRKELTASSRPLNEEELEIWYHLTCCSCNLGLLVTIKLGVSPLILTCYYILKALGCESSRYDSMKKRDRNLMGFK